MCAVWFIHLRRGEEEKGGKERDKKGLFFFSYPTSTVSFKIPLVLSPAHHRPVGKSVPALDRHFTLDTDKIRKTVFLILTKVVIKKKLSSYLTSISKKSNNVVVC